MSDDKTEEATPKRKLEARMKGQVARSTDLTGAIILLAGGATLAMLGPKTWGTFQELMRDGLIRAGHPEITEGNDGIAALGGEITMSILGLMTPIMFVVAIAGIVANVGQVGFKITPKALNPDFKKLNPLQGAKNVFGKNALVEAVKSLAKVSVVASVVAVAVLPKIEEIAGMTGTEPGVLAATLGTDVKGIAIRAAAIYLFIGAADLVWQKHRHAKGQRMSHQDIRMEHKQEELPPEVRGAIRRRQQEASRNRMMAAVPTADVVIMNPTHFAVALKYDPDSSAPTVVAKGQDIIALKIRDLGRESGVHVMEDPPLARALYAQVEVGHAIPEELFQAVAEVLAVVFRAARRRTGAVA
ncbi:flagellar biosynthesis protein FlhB [Patulibacter americanus]|uniref:flagellar biosynthesis protein FlhB n=1 Tax=Patulibacter americanus TaxID=588672 RepID=UPI0003B62C9D|nr:flagellar biosynthesis protein FlhB [Patulibacter americanus]